MDFVAPTRLQANQDVIAYYFGGPSGETLHYPNIDLASVVPADFDVTQRPWYVGASPAHDPARTVTWSTPYLDAARQGLVITGSFPIYDGKHGFRGVVAMDLQLNRMSYIVSSIHVGATGYGFVVDKDGRLIAMPDAGYKDLGMTPEFRTARTGAGPGYACPASPSGFARSDRKDARWSKRLRGHPAWKSGALH